MDLSKKINQICKENKFSSMKELAEKLEFPYTLFNKNVNKNILSGDMIKAFANHPNIRVDLRWLIRQGDIMTEQDSPSTYYKNPMDKFNEAMRLLEEYREEMSRM